MKARPKPREVIGGKKFKCHGKVCKPTSVGGYYTPYSICEYCRKRIKLEREK